MSDHVRAKKDRGNLASNLMIKLYKKSNRITSNDSSSNVNDGLRKNMLTHSTFFLSNTKSKNDGVHQQVESHHDESLTRSYRLIMQPQFSGFGVNAEKIDVNRSSGEPIDITIVRSRLKEKKTSG